MDFDGNLSLRQFLAHFDFDYDIVSAGGKYESKIRQELVEDDLLSPDDLDKDLICLIDCQGVYLGDIGKMRYPVQPDSVDKIIDRMDAYIQDGVLDEFRTALEDRGVSSENFSVEDLITKCKELNVGEGEVSYYIAGAIVHSEKIIIEELKAPKVSLDSQIETAQHLCDLKALDTFYHSKTNYSSFER